MKRVIIVGSPRSNGRSAHLAEMLFEANIDERPEDELFLVPISEIDVSPCIGCNACRKKSEVTFKNEDGNEVTELLHRCIFDDDMQTVYDLLDDADALTIVTPIYFSGLPGPMKCLIDRLQPYFWEYCENGPRLPKRPLELHVVGEGGDPHGFAPLVSEVKGSTALAGFGLERIFSWVGKIDAKGEIIAEAEEVPVPPRGSYAAFVGGEDAGSSGPVAGVAAYAPEEAKAAVEKESQVKATAGKEQPAKAAAGKEPPANAGTNSPQKSRPKLNLRQGQEPAQREKQAQRGKPAQARKSTQGQKGKPAQASKQSSKSKQQSKQSSASRPKSQNRGGRRG